ncbi:DUF2190 family protein [Marinobacterium lutimaris]|uniref:Predicted phage recombinase, RecA/RadA family n=1 Tax=Marinobacterium lutimaris TaxID=568106 RepID=A0A1H5XUP0_9GAMM|nr:capsid cement protein [Marinobacterium lutimaris]SEG14986.1 Predicted phage recombinase, RecA/RadA family [Marinobacterium lutimaris]
MATNKVQAGKVIPLTSTGAVLAGGVVVSGALVGVALSAIEAGARGQVDLEGVYNLPMAAENIAEGTPVYWDGSAITATATDNDLIGHAAAAGTSGDATIPVLLKG